MKKTIRIQGFSLEYEGDPEGLGLVLGALTNAIVGPQTEVNGRTQVILPGEAERITAELAAIDPRTPRVPGRRLARVRVGADRPPQGVGQEPTKKPKGRRQGRS